MKLLNRISRIFLPAPIPRSTKSIIVNYIEYTEGNYYVIARIDTECITVVKALKGVGFTVYRVVMNAEEKAKFTSWQYPAHIKIVTAEKFNLWFNEALQQIQD